MKNWQKLSVSAVICFVTSQNVFAQTPQIQKLLSSGDVAYRAEQKEDAYQIYQKALNEAISLKDNLGEARSLAEIGSLIFFASVSAS